jgi:hypothetical protein
LELPAFLGHSSTVSFSAVEVKKLVTGLEFSSFDRRHEHDALYRVARSFLRQRKVAVHLVSRQFSIVRRTNVSASKYTTSAIKRSDCRTKVNVHLLDLSPVRPSTALPSRYGPKTLALTMNRNLPLQAHPSLCSVSLTAGRLLLTSSAESSEADRRIIDVWSFW